MRIYNKITKFCLELGFYVCLLASACLLPSPFMSEEKVATSLEQKGGLVSCMNEKKVATLNPQRESLLT